MRFCMSWRNGHIACKCSPLLGLLSRCFSFIFATLNIVLFLLFFLADLEHESFIHVIGNIDVAGDLVINPCFS